MTPEQLDELLAIADRGAYLAPSDPSAGFDARAAASSDLAAMRQPITAEALTAAGWVEQSTGMYRRGPVFVEWMPNMPPIVVVVMSDQSEIVPWPTNMYDLAELVRLLGGGK